ncbi:Zn-ribbon domain-containing OB-fold protein [Nonomuraea sp. NPDC050394]|uniref:Zn-ribbon domain-containing OB-fold protein n=1 Tax=Nonomuraea sp. NPDC050394 TaxID=3364363 RepID=UPI0037A358A4
MADRLELQECRACGRRQHYPRPLCLGCGSADLGLREAGGGGSVDTFTEVRRAPSEDFEPPYVIARVRLDEGPVLLTRLVGPGPWACDERVRLTWWQGLPVFEKE